MSIVLQSSGGGSVTLQEAITASNLTITVPAVTGTMATTTTPSFTTTIGVGGATPAASGAGITFPATKSPSSDANTLDDYEEGTFTATITPSASGSVTLSASFNTMSYTKIGRLVTVTGQLAVSSISSPTGLFFINGLPFVSANFTYGAAGAAMFINNTASVAINSFIPYIGLNENRITVWRTNGTGLAADSAQQITSSTEFRLTASYIV